MVDLAYRNVSFILPDPPIRLVISHSLLFFFLLMVWQLFIAHPTITFLASHFAQFWSDATFVYGWLLDG